MTTERILPGIALPVPGVRARRDAVPKPSLREVPAIGARPAVRPATVRKQPILTTPARAGMLIGASAAVYAITLAGVAGLQTQSEASVMTSRAPYLNSLAATRAANDALEASLLKVDAQARALANSYAVVGENVGAYQARLDELAALVAEVEGSAAALPTRMSLPSVSMRGAVGGSSGGSSGGSGGGSTTATTGASGG
jgi:uncharacterized membrane protein YgcG